MTENDKQLPGEMLTHVPQMSLRDWFAGQFLSTFDTGPGGMNSDDIARMSYIVADAMMKARVK